MGQLGWVHNPGGTRAIFDSSFGTSAQDWTCLKDVCTQLKSASTIMFKETCTTFCKFSRSWIASQKGSIWICIFGIVDVFYGICRLDYTFMEYAHFYGIFTFSSSTLLISHLFMSSLSHKRRDICLVFLFANMRILEV